MKANAAATATATAKAKAKSTATATAKVLDRVRRTCLALPEAYEKVAWGAPTFRVGKRQFAMFLDNHHGDGRVALWCKAPEGAQEELVASNPDAFFVPPYVGGGGWVGIRLDRGLDWDLVAGLLRQAHAEAAPKPRAARAARAVKIRGA